MFQAGIDPLTVRYLNLSILMSSVTLTVTAAKQLLQRNVYPNVTAYG